jgi:hypothetical protein
MDIHGHEMSVDVAGSLQPPGVRQLSTVHKRHRRNIQLATQIPFHTPSHITPAAEKQPAPPPHPSYPHPNFRQTQISSEISSLQFDEERAATKLRGEADGEAVVMGW